MAMGVDLIGPAVEHDLNYLVDVLPVFGRSHITDFPVSLNIPASKGDVTGVAAQYTNPTGLECDGHHISYSMDEVKYQYGCFLKTAVEGEPMILAPQGDQDAPCRPLNQR